MVMQRQARTLRPIGDAGPFCGSYGEYPWMRKRAAAPHNPLRISPEPRGVSNELLRIRMLQATFCTIGCRLASVHGLPRLSVPRQSEDIHHRPWSSENVHLASFLADDTSQSRVSGATRC